MEITFASADDRAGVRTLWDVCFGDARAYTDTFFSCLYKAEGTVVAKDGAAVIGSLQLFPHTLCINGEKIQAMYIGGVDVLPAYRRQGIARRLMDFAENHMRERDIAVSFLVPASAGIYRGMGYTPLSYLSDFSGPIAALSPFVLTDASLAPVSVPPLDAYAAFAMQFPLYAERDSQRYTQEIFPLCNAQCLALDADAGYILFTVHDGVLQGLECAYRDETALRRILGFIYKNFSDLDRFCIRLPADGTGRRLLAETTIRETRFLHAMAKSSGPVQLTESMGNYINMLGWI